MAKRKRKMTAEGRRRISIAMKKRWAAYRKAGGNSRPRKAGTASGRNAYLNMSVAELIAAKRQCDDACKVARKLLR